MKKTCFSPLLIAVFLCSLLLCGSTKTSHAQSPSVQETIAYINSKLMSNCSLDVRRSVIVSQCYDASHKLYREDRVIVSELDVTRMGCEAKDSLFFISCIDDAGSCVEREMFITGNSRPYPRISFQLANGLTDFESVKKAFLHLEQMIDNHKYKETVIFEPKK